MRRALSPSWLLSLLALCGLSCGGPGEDAGDTDDPTGACSDRDGDGYGAGDGCAGPDCDDENPDLWDEAQCADRCEDDPRATGCACDPAENPEPEVCFDGPPETLGVGVCVAGLRRCEDGVWSSCVGQVVPSEETCDFEDDDCDGEVDEDVRSACNDCNPDCGSTCFGIGCEDGFAPDDSNSTGVVLDETGALVLDGTTVSFELIWVANTLEGTVSKIDTRTREELARYRTGVFYAGRGGMWGGLGPSRTSVGFRGDVVVGNRAFGQVGSATKILAEDCPDGGDGRVDTSSGRTDVLRWDVDDEWEDDCIAWHTHFGEENGVPRAVAVQEIVALDGVLEERVWIGLCVGRRYVELDGADGEPTGREVETPELTPYGAAIGRDGILWSAGHVSAGIGRIDTETLDYEFIRQEGGPGYCYGMTVDEEGDVWCGGWASVYRVADDEWEEVPVPGNGSLGMSVVHGVAADGVGSIWMAYDSRRSFFRVNRDDASDFTEIAATINVFGVGIDFDGHVWGIGWRGSEGIAIADIESEEVEVVMGVADCDGEACLNGPYTYSDMTGFQLRNATNPLGEYRAVIEGCEGAETRWASVGWEANVPPSTSIALEVRTAASLPELAALAFVRVASDPPDVSPADLAAALEDAGMEPARYLELRLLLMSAARDVSPRVESFSVEFSCGDVLG